MQCDVIQFRILQKKRNRMRPVRPVKSPSCLHQEVKGQTWPRRLHQVWGENYENRLLGSETQSLSQRNDTQQAQRKYPGLQRNKVTKSVKDHRQKKKKEYKYSSSSSSRRRIVYENNLVLAEIIDQDCQESTWYKQIELRFQQHNLQASEYTRICRAWIPLETCSDIVGQRFWCSNIIVLELICSISLFYRKTNRDKSSE